MNVSQASRRFKRRSKQALLDEDLQQALGMLGDNFVVQRKIAVDALPEFEKLREAANEIREHSLNHLDYYLELFERNVERNGGKVHWASTPEEMRQIIVDICKDANAKLVTKGKSMVSEEVDLHDAMQQAGIERMETDLGEYIIQLADEPPSHIIAPAIHKTRDQISDLFHKHHQKYGIHERVDDRAAIVGEARKVLRQAFVNADVGITGANFLIAETGSSALVTNEGNGDLTSNLPRVHIVTAGIEKLIPSLEDLSVFLRLLARSATGQEITAYTTVYSGPARQGEEGPEAYHVVLLDNGRSTMLGNEFRDMLRCIRCGACLNHCPVYGSIGGHSYGWVYSGPMGSVLTPLFNGLDASYDLPNACTLNGRCQQVCPMRIPLPGLLRKLRQKQSEARITPRSQRWMLALWARLATRPKAYQWLTGFGMRLLAFAGRKKGYLGYVPFAGGWTRGREMPAPAGRTFMQQWRDLGK